MLISNLYSILSVIIVLRAQVRACNDNNYEQLAMAQDSDDYLSNNYYGLLFKPWPFNYYYEQNTFGSVDDENNDHYFDHNFFNNRLNHPYHGGVLRNWNEGRSQANNNYFGRPLNRFDPLETTHLLSGPESRISPSLRNSLNNFGLKTRFSALTSGISSWLEGTACTTANAESGICTNSRVCSNNGGRTGGSCTGSFGNICCINTVNQCGATVTLNNTYWQSPTIINSDSTCYVSIQLDTTSIAKSICQIRLDFDAFSIAQPNTQTLCNIDNFRVNGATNKVPTICGQNNGQHMYLTVPSPASDIQLIFTLGTGVSQYRNWKIRISMLPCSSTAILAPNDCLQYFTQSTGTVWSFNWREASPVATAPRQLANQDYNICFRTEQISSTNAFSKASSTICFAPCVIMTLAAPLTTPLAFSLTGDSTSPVPMAGAGAGANPPQCANTDYLIIDSAADPALPTNFNDRFCGNEFNAQTVPVATTSTTLCTTVKPFNILYRTDGSEATTEVANNGFCLRFEQRA